MPQSIPLAKSKLQSFLVACVYLLDLSLIPHSCHPTLLPSFTLNFSIIVLTFAPSSTSIPTSGPLHILFSLARMGNLLCFLACFRYQLLLPFHSDLSLWLYLNKQHSLLCHSALSCSAFLFLVLLNALLTVVSRIVPGM